MMMPPDNITKKDQEIINQGSKIKTTRPTPTPPPEQGVLLKCPRCDSPNTKFCYYNNYSLTQPRHFCKTCRRYWTNGGALRNVPIGGGCRKNHNKKKEKKTPSSSSISSRLSCDSSSKDSASSSSELSAGLRFFHINNSSSPSLEFHLGGLPLIPSRLHQQQPSFTNQFSSFGATSAASSFQLDPSGGDPDSLIGLNHPFSSSTGSGLFNNGAAIIQGMNNSSMNVNSTSSSALASSIESLSSMNQDLHWKLQQQRLAMMFTGGDNNNNQKDKDSCSTVSLPQVNKPQPILFQNLEISKPEMFQGGGDSRKGEGPSGDAPIEWFFGTHPTTTTTTTSSVVTVVNGHDDNAANNNWGSGVHAWGDVQQPYSVLP